MSDKARRLYVVPLSFSDGEVPPAAKLTALSSQARRGLQVLERIVGDPWNQSGDPVLSPGADPSLNALHIPNLARAIGDLALLNPRTFAPSGLNQYTDAIGARYPNRHIAYLLFVPTASGGGAFIAADFTFAGNGGAFAAGGFQVDPDDIDAAGEWSVDVSGKVYSYTPIPFSTTITYNPNIGAMETSNLVSGSWNVIPDPTTWAGSFAGLKIIYTNGVDGTGGYTLYLPPRMPLGSARDTAMRPSSATENLDSTPNTGAMLFQDSTVDASTLAHYKYRLPSVLQSLAAGTILPEGFLYLWDETSGTIVEGLTFDVSSASSSIRVDVTGTELTNLFGGLISAGGHVSTAADESAAAYRSRWKLIVHGTSLAQHVDSITARFLDHQHRAGDSPPIRHEDLEGLVTPTQNATTNPDYPTGASAFPPASRWADDHHLQYLHRRGSPDDPLTRRDYLDNAMLGDLLLEEGIIFRTVVGANLGRGQLHYDSARVFKLSASVDSSSATTPTIENSILAVGTIRILPEDNTDVRTFPNQSTTTGPRLTLRGPATGVMEVTTRNADLRIDVPTGQQLHIFTGSSLGALTPTSENDIFIRSNADDVVIEAGDNVFLRAGSGTWASGGQSLLPEAGAADILFSAQDDFRVRVGDQISFEYQGAAGTFLNFDNRDMTQLVGQGFAIDPDATTRHLHRHNIWRHAAGASSSYNFLGCHTAGIIVERIGGADLTNGQTITLTYTFSTQGITVGGTASPALLNVPTPATTSLNDDNQTSSFSRPPFVHASMTLDTATAANDLFIQSVSSSTTTATINIVVGQGNWSAGSDAYILLSAIGLTDSTTAVPGV